MMYLHFDTMEQVESVLTRAGFRISQYKDHCNRGRIQGTIFKIPISVEHVGDEVIETFEDGIFVNLFDCDQLPELSEYQIATPNTPYNVRA